MSSLNDYSNWSSFPNIGITWEAYSSLFEAYFSENLNCESGNSLPVVRLIKLTMYFLPTDASAFSQWLRKWFSIFLSSTLVPAITWFSLCIWWPCYRCWVSPIDDLMIRVSWSWLPNWSRIENGGCDLNWSNVVFLYFI